jgi:hypothetical protein
MKVLCHIALPTMFLCALFLLESSRHGSLQPAPLAMLDGARGGKCQDCEADLEACLSTKCTPTKTGSTYKQGTQATENVCVDANPGGTLCSSDLKKNCLQPMTCTDGACKNCTANGAPTQVDTRCAVGGTYCTS